MYYVTIESNDREQYPDLKRKINLYRKLDGKESIHMEFHLEKRLERSKNKEKMKHYFI